VLKEEEEEEEKFWKDEDSRCQLVSVAWKTMGKQRGGAGGEQEEFKEMEKRWRIHGEEFWGFRTHISKLKKTELCQVGDGVMG
jgi:hypothetical protein